MTGRRKPDYSASPQRISDIQIERVYQAICADHGVIDQHREYAVVAETRRAHFDQDHTGRAA